MREEKKRLSRKALSPIYQEFRIGVPAFWFPPHALADTIILPAGFLGGTGDVSRELLLSFGEVLKVLCSGLIPVKQGRIDVPLAPA